MPKLQTGDRIGYAAKCLRNIGAFSGETPKRRGTFLAMDKTSPYFARVRWDDFEARESELAKQYGDDYVLECRANGQMVHIKNIAKVGSPRFVSNDL